MEFAVTLPSELVVPMTVMLSPAAMFSGVPEVVIMMGVDVE